MKLSELYPLAGSRKLRTRVGRGESSGHGKTSGHGGKGQTARSGGTVSARFEGGQMPLYRRMAKVGFRSKQKSEGANQYSVVNVSVLEKFDAGATVDMSVVRARGYARTGSNRAGLKIVGGGTLSKKLTVRAQAFSASAKAKIEAAGGVAEVVSCAGKAMPA